MRIKLNDIYHRDIRARISEIIASRKLKGILTTKYPPEVLDQEFFNEMHSEDKLFLKKYWNSFDIFKPVFAINHEIPEYKGFILYEVKSILSPNEENLNKKPIIKISLNQKRLFEESVKKQIPLKFIFVHFLSNWEIEYGEYDCKEIETELVPTSGSYEERMKRIKSSKLNQFWHDLFPTHVLYKIDDKELESLKNKNTEDYLNEIIETPLTDTEKEMLINRAIKTRRKIPDFIEKRDSSFKKRSPRIEDYNEYLKEVKKLYPHAYEPWSKEDENKLIKLFLETKKIDYISSALGRKEGGIKSRLKKLGMLY